MSGDIVARIREAVELNDWATKNQHEKAVEALAKNDYSAAATACRRAYQYQCRIVALLEVIDE